MPGLSQRVTRVTKHPKFGAARARARDRDRARARAEFSETVIDLIAVTAAHRLYMTAILLQLLVFARRQQAFFRLSFSPN